MMVLPSSLHMVDQTGPDSVPITGVRESREGIKEIYETCV